MASDQREKILVIEDDEDIRTVVTTRLKRAGYETIVAADGMDGLRRFYGDRPDLVVLDIAMPVMDGWQVL
jgi:CheY-like chemotaxis protein